MRISDWSSDVCSSDLRGQDRIAPVQALQVGDFLALEALAAKQKNQAESDQRGQYVNDDVKQRRAISLARQRPLLDDAREQAQKHEAPEIGRAPCRERVCQYV